MVVELRALRIELRLRLVDLRVRLRLRLVELVLRAALQRLAPHLLAPGLHGALDRRHRRGHERIVVVGERILVLGVGQPHDDGAIDLRIGVEDPLKRPRRHVEGVVVRDRRAERGS